METSNATFRQHLQKELEHRTKRNARFSIRAFARALEIEPSSLAQILSGKRPLTNQMCWRVGTKLGLSPTRMRVLMKGAPPPNTLPFEGFKKLTQDAFRVIADWHYYAILELTRTDGFKGNINWISNSLGISTAETSVAIERLKKLGYLKIESDGTWVDTMGSAQNLGNEVSLPAFREHQKQVLAKSISALEEIPYDERVQSSMTLVGSKERIQEAKKRILTFIEELDEFMKSGDTKDEVYSISVSLFPLSKNKRTPL